MTKKFLTTGNGNVSGVEVCSIEWKNIDGRFAPTPIPGTEEIIEADMVLLALGFIGAEENLLQQLQVAQDERSNIKANTQNYRTNHERIFAAGDARRGQSLVVWAIQEGRAAARECDRFLMGGTNLP